MLQAGRWLGSFATRNARKPDSLRQGERDLPMADTNEAGDQTPSDELVALAFFTKEVKPEDIKLGMLPVLDASNYDMIVDVSKLTSTLKEYELIDE